MRFEEEKCISNFIEKQNPLSQWIKKIQLQNHENQEQSLEIEDIIWSYDISLTLTKFNRKWMLFLNL